MQLSEEMLSFIEEMIPGNKAIFRFDGEKFGPVYISSDFYELNGYTEAEFMDIIRNDPLDALYSEDVGMLMSAVRVCIEDGCPVDCYVRTKHKNKNYEWLHLNARICGEIGGDKVFLLLAEGSRNERDIYLDILNNTRRRIYVSDCSDFKILYANKAAREYGANQAEDPLGIECYSYLFKRDRQCDDCFMKSVGDGGSLSRDCYNERLGKWERFSGRYIDWCGHRAFVQYIDDISDMVLRQQELQNLLEIHSVQMQAVQILNEQSPIDVRMNAAVELLRSYYQADRTYMFSVDEGGTTVSNSYEACSAGVSPQIDFLQKTDIHYMDRWRDFFDRHEVVVQKDIEDIRKSNPDEYDIMLRQDIHSYIEAPVIIDGVLAGFIGADNPQPEKMLHSAELLLSFAYSAGNALQKEKNERQLREHAQELEQSHKMYSAAIELADLAVWVYDIKNHRIVLKDSRAARADREAYSIPAVIENVIDASSEWVEERDMNGLRAMYRSLDEGAKSVSCQYWYKSRPGVKAKCERIFYTATADEEGRPLFAYGIGMDITSLEQERMQYRQSIETLLSANPDAIGTFRLNLTMNLFVEGHSPYSYISDALKSETVDGFFANVADMIIGDEGRLRYLADVNRVKLLKLFESGIHNHTAEYRRRLANGEIQWVRAYFSILRNPDTEDIECVTYAQDITKSYINNAIFDLITNQEFDYVALLHMHSSKIEFPVVNKRLSKLYRDAVGCPGKLYDFDDIRKFTASSWVDREDREYYLENSPVSRVREFLDRDGHFEMSIRGHTYSHPDEYMCRKIQHYYLDDDRDTVLIIQTDVTETYLQEQREAANVKAEAERVTDILDSVSSGICVLHMTDPDHLLGDFVNLQMFRILGFTPKNAEERPQLMCDPIVKGYLQDAFSAVHPEDAERVKRTYRANYASEHFNAGTYRIMRKDGSSIWVNQDVMLREVTPEYRVLYTSYRVVDREIELQDQLEKQLEEEKELREQATSANIAKSEFLSRMSHDMRTPLNGIIGMTYLMKDMELDERAREGLKKIDTSSKFLLGLINDILDMTKAESKKIELHPEPYTSEEFRGYLEAVIRPLCDDKHLKFRISSEHEDDAVPVFDKLRINQVLFNLLSNSVKYTPEGGTVTYKDHFSRPDSSGKVMAEINIIDTGIGMSGAFQQVLFEPFSREERSAVTETQGTGLGLAIAKRMTDLMGGTISVKSRIGRGTAFTIKMTVDSMSPQKVIEEESISPEGNDLEILDGAHILVCEDHPLNQEIVRSILEGKNVIVEMAENGQRGVEAFSRSLNGFYDAILMDIRMPVMNGYDAAKAIRALDRSDAERVPIIALTADAFLDDAERAKAAGMDGHVSKPIDPQALFGTIAHFIRMSL